MARKKHVGLPVLEVRPDGTYPVADADPASAKRMRRRGADPTTFPGPWCASSSTRGQPTGGSQMSQTFTLITDILDPAALSAEQAARPTRGGES